MAKSMMSMAKGVATGLCVGMAVGYVGKIVKDDKRKGKKLANKAIKTVSEIMDSLVKG